ncbi:MAG TPA: serine/threonine-protein kinase [Candidatus Binatia bacterium]|nr:serine/threonine-protein kinase [Candidatus Binatia bacterium]
MKFLPDQVVARLQTGMQTPDLSGTRYRALELLGQGGMGAVWLAQDAILQRPVALKVLTAENSSADLAARLMQEAIVLARLEHPGIVPVHDAGTLPDGRTFYCMKLVEGQTLDRYVLKLPLRERLRLVQRIAEPLAFAHSRGIIHRDLKPANVMVGAFGEVLIMDWGLAKVMAATGASLATGQVSEHAIGDSGVSSQTKQDPGHTTGAVSTAKQKLGHITDAIEAPPKTTQVSGREFTRAVPAPLGAGALAPENATAHGSILGTPGYMAPEQERGDVNLIDQRTDVFALGSILKDLLQEPPGSPHTEAYARPLQAIRAKAMSAEMSARYASVQELAADVGRYLDGMPVTAYRENIFERTGRLVSRNRVAVVLVLAYLFMRLLFILFSRR